jgi:methylthioribose-1-phosphate isomerase
MSLVQSPLFEPVLWQGSGFKILDELQVPEKIVYLDVSHVGQALDAVCEMKTRAFGQVLTFLYSGALLALNHPDTNAEALRERLAQMTRQFCAARPTFDFGGLGAFFDDWFKDLPAADDPRESIARNARQLGQQIVRGRLARAKLAASILPNSARVLTHCNISGELVAIAQFCQNLGKDFSVIATETRPYLQGARLTAWELERAGVPVSIIPDCAVAQVMDQSEVNAVIVGADRSAQNGDIINKVGTYPLALLAKEAGVPFHALVQDPRSLATGNDVRIEERPAAELLMFQGQSLVAQGSKNLNARYPSFDVTPAALITSLIGFDDIYTAESFRQKYQIQPTRHDRGPEQPGQYLLVYGVPPKNQYGFLASALKAEKAESILVPEMRPHLWGAQAVAPKLLERNLPTTLISDNMMGTLFAQGEIRKLCLFYDTLTEAGPSGICGSLLAARLARLHGVGIELFSGAAERGPTPDSDASTFLGKTTCPAGVKVRTVGAEVISWSVLKN